MSLSKKFLRLYVAQVIFCLVPAQNNDSSPGDILLASCHVAPNVNSPSELNAGPNVTTKVNVTLKINRFLKIDDVDESMTLGGSIIMLWLVDCQQSLIQKGIYLFHKAWVLILREDPSRFWWPDIIHRNSVNDVALMGDGFRKSLMIIPPLGAFSGQLTGRFESHCDLDFTMFPFDTQQCTVELLLQQSVTYAEITEARLDITDLTMPYNSNWERIDTTGESRGLYPTASDAFVRLGISPFYSAANFTLKLRRKSNYYLLNLYAPCVILSLLELASFMIPADLADRAAFASTVMLSVIVLRDPILTSMPQTPHPIIASFYALGMTVYALLCATYSAAMCTFVVMFPEKAKRKVINSYEFYCVIDVVAFIIAGVLLLTFNVGIALYYVAAAEN